MLAQSRLSTSTWWITAVSNTACQPRPVARAAWVAVAPSAPSAPTSARAPHDPGQQPAVGAAVVHEDEEERQAGGGQRAGVGEEPGHVAEQVEGAVGAAPGDQGVDVDRRGRGVADGEDDGALDRVAVGGGDAVAGDVGAVGQVALERGGERVAAGAVGAGVDPLAVGVDDLEAAEVGLHRLVELERDRGRRASGAARRRPVGTTRATAWAEAAPADGAGTPPARPRRSGAARRVGAAAVIVGRSGSTRVAVRRRGARSPRCGRVRPPSGSSVRSSVRHSSHSRSTPASSST